MLKPVRKHSRKKTSAVLAQLVERWSFKPVAVGSIPTYGKNFFLLKYLKI